MSDLELHIHRQRERQRERGCIKEYLTMYICEYSKRKENKGVREREREQKTMQTNVDFQYISYFNFEKVCLIKILLLRGVDQHN